MTGVLSLTSPAPGKPRGYVRETVPGSGNFCLLTGEPVERFAAALRGMGIEVVDGPGERDGATGKIVSVYLRDPDGNLVEVSNRLAPAR